MNLNIWVDCVKRNRYYSGDYNRQKVLSDLEDTLEEHLDINSRRFDGEKFIKLYRNMYGDLS